METLNKLHYKFDALSLSYAEFIIYISENGIAPQEARFSGQNVNLFIEVDTELATLLKLKFGYFQIKVKSEEEIREEAMQQIRAFEKMMKTQEFYEKRMWEPYYKSSKSKLEDATTYDHIYKSIDEKWINDMKDGR